MNPRYLYLILCLSMPIVHLLAFTVTGLSVNHLTNPSGIDCSEMTVGWKIVSDQRNVAQQAYQIDIFSDEKQACREWSSVHMVSSQSTNISLAYLPLHPESTYFWQVSVTDTNGKTVTSHEKAYFRTGLMDNWSGAQWLRLGDNWVHTNKPNYIVEADMKILSGNPAIIFGWTDNRAYFMWQFITDNSEIPILRKYICTYNDELWYQDVPITTFSTDQLIGAEHRVRIDCTGAKIITYIDEIIIDDFSNQVRRVPAGQIGFRTEANSNDQALFDNLNVYVKFENGKCAGLLKEDFNKGCSQYFTNGEIVEDEGNCKLRIKGGEAEEKVIEQPYLGAYFFQSFDIEKKIASAILYSSALGVYDIYINDQRVGHKSSETMDYEELKPGWTDYHKRVQYSTFDITSMLCSGCNSIGAVVTSGWLSGQIAKNQYKGMPLAFIAKLVVTYQDGSTQTYVTDTDWKCSKFGPVKKGDIYHGEFYDSTVPFPWQDECELEPNIPSIYAYSGTIVPFQGQNVKALESLTPILYYVYDSVLPGSDFGLVNIVEKGHMEKSIKLKKGETAIFDFGQNFTGIPYLSVRGEKGCKLHMRFAEMLNDSGLLSRANDGPEGSLYLANLRSAKAELYYVINGNNQSEEFRPTTTFYGFRYCEITADRDITILSLEALPLTASHIQIGDVVTDNELINKLSNNILWGQRSNLLSVPMDCPQRDERLGWTADTHLFMNTALYNAQVSEFYRKWLQDVRDAQREDGAYSDVAPLSLSLYGNAAWADAGIIVPWNLYLMTGDKDIIREHYDSMLKYMEWLESQSSASLIYPGAGTSYGDWLAFSPTNSRYVSQAFYAYCASLMSKIAKSLSNSSQDSYAWQSVRFAELYKSIKSEIQKVYFNENGLIKPTQTACILALKFNLCQDEQQMILVKQQLSAQIVGNGYKLDTGFIGTAYINQVLSDFGLSDLSYDLLLQRQFPSWLYSVDQGATTLWERWNSYTKEDGFGDASMNSFNHYAYGAIGEWMYRNMAGIMPDVEAPGFENIIFKPQPDFRSKCNSGERIKHVKAKHDSNYGLIEAEWNIADDDAFTYRVVIPSNARGKVYFPASNPDLRVYENGVDANESEGVEYIGYFDGCKVYNVQSGAYKFSTNCDFSSSVSTGIDGINIKAYPNPTRDLITISIEGDATPLALYIFNACGQKVRNLDPANQTIDMSALPSGIYFLTVFTDKGRSTRRIVKI